MKGNAIALIARVAWLTVGAAVVVGVTTPWAASAQDQEGNKASGGAVELEKVEITGSRIKRIDLEGPTPVATVTREQIEKLGYTTVEDVLGNLTYNAGGTFGAGQSFSFAKGTESIDLRGFGAGRTLVLLDGRRLPVFPQGLGGTDAFVDLSTIPVSIVERIEVLLDGASAIYGSDAVSGVVNIITRKDVAGSEVTARFEGTDDGGGAERRFTFLQGIQGSEGSIQIAGEYIKQQVLKFTDRDFSESDFTNNGNGSGFGNTFVGEDFATALAIDPNCESPTGPLLGAGRVVGAAGSPGQRCRFDRSVYRQFIPDSEKSSVYVRADRKIGTVNSFARLGYFHSRLKYELEPNAYQGGESTAFPGAVRIFPQDAFDQTFGPGYVAAGAANNPTTGTGNEQGGFFFRRLVEFGPRGSDLTNDSFNGLVGLTGNFGEYNWEAGVGRNETRLKGITPTILSSVLDNEVSNNDLDLFDTISDDIIRRASHTQIEQAVSRNTTLDATVSGPLGLALPGGMTQFAIHADYDDEDYFDRFDAISTAGDVFDGANGGGGKREYYGIGAELSFPILNNLELGVAGRYDSYHDDSDVGSAFSPSARVGYRPLTNVLLRASYGKSFRAPDLQRLFGAQSAGFETVIDTPTCVAAGGTPGTQLTADENNDPCLAIQSVPSVTGSNVKLKEEKGRNFNVGLSVEPIKSLNVKVDYYQIKVDDIVDTLSAQQLLDNCASTGSFCDQITRNPTTGLLGTPGSGGDNSALISASALNLSTQEIHGLDSEVSYDFNATAAGKFGTAFVWSHITSLKVRSLQDGPLVEQIGFGQTILAAQNRFSLTLNWDLDMYGATLRIDRVGRYPGSNSLVVPATSDQFVDSYTTVNLQGRVDFGKFGMITVGVDNLLDEDFPLDPTFADNGPNTQNQFLGEATSFFADPLGRRGYISYKLHF